ncbi:inorganic phosphate transporter [Alkalinema pantanalense CENA528]|uniref:inorganic phosphate transporter n=1 Tax=Alkalinema pantanalense TaxID=1620705 RepID=UPI003D6F3FDF
MWILILSSGLAFYLAWNLGANDVANSMGTSVGSKAITLRQALVIAGILEFVGAVLFGRGVSQKLATGVVNPSLFLDRPDWLLWGMVAVLITTSLWLNLATYLGLPVSSSHATVGAIAGMGWIAWGFSAVNWKSIGTISLSWIATPVLSGCLAALLYSLLRFWIFDRPNPDRHLQEWIPWLAVLLTGTFGVIVLPTVVTSMVALPSLREISLPPYTISLGIGSLAAIIITFALWGSISASADLGLLRFQLETVFARFQLLSACCVAFAHGSNDVGNAIAPFAAILSIDKTHQVPLADLTIPLWVLAWGGLGIVTGLALWGHKVMATIGEGIIPLQPSGGFCAELATAMTILCASRLGLPVSTSHALVGAVVGIGCVQNWRSIQLSTLRSIGLSWVATIPIAVLLGAGSFYVIRILMPIVGNGMS